MFYHSIIDNFCRNFFANSGFIILRKHIFQSIALISSSLEDFFNSPSVKGKRIYLYSIGRRDDGVKMYSTDANLKIRFISLDDDIIPYENVISLL